MTKRKSKLQRVAEFLDKHNFSDYETIGSISANELRHIIGKAETPEEVGVLNRLEQGTPVREIRELLP